MKRCCFVCGKTDAARLPAIKPRRDRLICQDCAPAYAERRKPTGILWNQVLAAARAPRPRCP